MLTLMTTALLCGGFYFSDATVYDEKLDALRDGVHIVVNDKGKVTLVAYAPTEVGEDVTRVDGALVLPHFSDFYSLVQDRGLGFDENISADAQGRMARYYRALGMYTVRDPMFPAAGLGEEFKQVTHVMAQNGYLAMKGGPAESFGLLVGPDARLDSLDLPRKGPITLWWTDVGTGVELQWPKHPALVKRLVHFAHKQGRKIGAYIQDAKPAVMDALFAFEFDFYEGMPAEGTRVSRFPDNITWVPLLAMNDKRYCAVNLDINLARAGKLGLYGALDISQVERNFDTIRARISERCSVWKKRRKNATAEVREWLESDGAVGIGSAGGHMFALSGDIRTELETLEAAGATQMQLLQAMFETNPLLLGEDEPYLKPGRPAHFVVYVQNGYWLSRLGERVDYNFVKGVDTR